MKGAWQQACRQALQWRLLLLWTILLALPTLLLIVPSWLVLGRLLDYSVHAARMAASADVALLGDLISLAIGEKAEVMSLTLILSMLVTLLLSPLMSGMAVTALRAARPPGFAALLQGGAQEYGRMGRLLLLGLLLLGAGLAGFAGLQSLAQKQAESAILHSDTLLTGYGSLAAGFLLLALLHAILDSARADFALDTRRRSAFKALWRGLKSVCRRPLLTLWYYGSITLLAMLLILPLLWLRINVPHAAWPGFLFALLLMQVVVAILAWMRNARLFALAAIARSYQPASLQAGTMPS